jgi:hypothetical protein
MKEQGRMNCLTDIEVQAAADGEATEAHMVHVSGCARCRERIDTRRREVAAVTSAITGGDLMSPAFVTRMRNVITDGRGTHGATRLRGPEPRRRQRSAWLAAAAAVAAAILLIVFLMPKIGAPTTLSASEVLGKSLQSMTGAKGVELLEYELFVPGGMNASRRIEHLIDHDHPGRYRFTKYAPDGTIESAAGQDSATGQRFLLVRADGHGVLMRIAPGTSSRISMPEVAQSIIETAITMMQANRDQTLTVQDTPAGRQYVVEIPRAHSSTNPGVFDLYTGRAVIDGENFGIQEFEASGSVLRQPYSMSFKLIRRTLRPSADVSADEFAAPVTPSDVVINTSATDDPISDILTAFVRELNRGKGH